MAPRDPSTTSTCARSTRARCCPQPTPQPRPAKQTLTEVFAVGSTDRLFYRLHISYVGQIDFWRFGVWVIPIVIFFLTRSATRPTEPLVGTAAREETRT